MAIVVIEKSFKRSTIVKSAFSNAGRTHERMLTPQGAKSICFLYYVIRPHRTLPITVVLLFQIDSCGTGFCGSSIMSQPYRQSKRFFYSDLGQWYPVQPFPKQKPMARSGLPLLAMGRSRSIQLSAMLIFRRDRVSVPTAQSSAGRGAGCVGSAAPLVCGCACPCPFCIHAGI